MRRREFVTALGGTVAAWPLAARAQRPEPIRRVGVLMSTAEDDAESKARIAAFLHGLQQSGWTEDRKHPTVRGHHLAAAWQVGEGASPSLDAPLM